MLKTLLFSLNQVFSNPRYILLTIITLFIVLSISIWLPNFNFLSHIAISDTFSSGQKIGIISSVFGSFQTNFTTASKITTVLISLLFALNLSFFVYFFLRSARLSREAGIGTGGFILGIIALGCASCGSIILTSILGIGATAAFIGILPLNGLEFGLISILLLGMSIFLLSKKISNPLVCNAKPVSLKYILSKTPLWIKAGVLIILAFLIGILFTNIALSRNELIGDALAQKFEYLQRSGNSSCSGDFSDSIALMPEGSRIQGSCCSPMSFHRYSEQIEGLKKFSDIEEIPPDPYDIDAGLAKQLKSYYDSSLTPDEQKEYDFAMENSNEKGPCCCKCWRWYVYGGLAKYLIQNYKFTGEQITQVWNLSDGCGGEGDHVNH